MQLFAELSPSHLFLAALLATSLLMLYHTRRRWQQAAQSRPVEKPAAAHQRWDKSHTAQSPAELRQWEVQVHEFARDVSARIDSKMAALEHLMRAAHHETLRLEAAIAKAQGSLSPEAPPAPAAVEFTPVSQARVLEQTVRNAARITPPQLPPKPHMERPYARIYCLADEGRTSQQIAAETEMPLGEVELILGLRQQA
jgi:hypothetical protein